MTRKSLIARITKHGASLRTLGAKTVEVTWLLAQDLVTLQGTYPQGKEGAAAFKAAAATASGKGEATIANLVRAIEVRNSLSAAQRKDVAGWSYDMVLSLAGKDMTPAKRTTLIGKVAKSGTRSPIEVRKLKRTVTGGTKRTRQTAAEQTTKLAAAIGKDVAKLIAKGHDPVTLAAGARLAQDSAGKDVASAILFVATQTAAAAKVVAK